MAREGQGWTRRAAPVVGLAPWRPCLPGAGAMDFASRLREAEGAGDQRARATAYQALLGEALAAAQVRRAFPRTGRPGARAREPRGRALTRGAEPRRRDASSVVGPSRRAPNSPPPPAHPPQEVVAAGVIWLWQAARARAIPPAACPSSFPPDAPESVLVSAPLFSALSRTRARPPPHTALVAARWRRCCILGRVVAAPRRCAPSRRRCWTILWTR